MFSFRRWSFIISTKIKLTKKYELKSMPKASRKIWIFISPTNCRLLSTDKKFKDVLITITVLKTSRFFFFFTFLFTVNDIFTSSNCYLSFCAAIPDSTSAMVPVSLQAVESCEEGLAIVVPMECWSRNLLISLLAAANSAWSVISRSRRHFISFCQVWKVHLDFRSEWIFFFRAHIFL